MNEKPIVIETHKKPDSAVIWLHGLGADGRDFAGLVPALRLPERARTRFVFPHAPVRPITLNEGMEMRGWYDITSLDPDKNKEDVEGIEAARKSVMRLIKEQIDSGVPAQRIVLAGFSQGGAIALITGLQGNLPLGGILALSAYLPAGLADKMPKAKPHSPPVMMMHGEFDDVVSLEYGKASKEQLLKLGYSVSWKTYPMAHQVCPQQLQIIRDWLSKRVLVAAKVAS